ncbi:MAG: carbamoyltransferase HypF [Ignisphaera sp.]
MFIAVVLHTTNKAILYFSGFMGVVLGCRDVRAVKIRIVGTVQGVGFRPFIYRLATSLNLKGYVVNLGGSEVEIHVEGEENQIEIFISRLTTEKPPPAKIVSIEIREVEPQYFASFKILRSSKSLSARSSIPPDVAICWDCINEIYTEGSRFYRYPWNSCAWCGPRFSMMYDIPYDRENTAMFKFKLCEECSKEYSDPSNIRRFHAQGISCSRCGPKTFVYRSSGERIYVEDPVSFIAQKILEGCIVAIKGIGGYHIACLATRDDVVLELRSRKRRPSQPFALMAKDFDIVNRIAIPPPGARELLESPQRPIVVMPKRPGSPLSEYVAPALSTIGVMLPYTGFQVMLLNTTPDGFLIMTSGNVHGKPMCTDLECIFSELVDVVDYVVEHERQIVHRVDDSVIRFTDGVPVFLRRARGYAPEWIETQVELLEGVAVGAELQTAGAVGFENKVVLTQFIGDIDEPAQLEDLEKELRWFIKVYRLNPMFIALDKHPLYHNRSAAKKLAREFGAELIEVQHHHAHIASVMGEVGVSKDEEVVGIAIDGTGYGDDGGIWGGEVITASYRDYMRTGSLEPFILPGGDSSAIYPVKSLISIMASAGYSEDEVLDTLDKMDLFKGLPHGRKEGEVIYYLSKSGKGMVTTSIGRVLDAFSALLNICTFRSYEGEPPIKLEAVADIGKDLGYTPRLRSFGDRIIVSVSDMLRWVLDNIGKERKEDIATTIQRGFGRALGEAALVSLKGRRNAKQYIVIGGGAAANTHIVRGVKEVLKEYGVDVILPRRLPPSDGGIAFGQIIIASSKAGK